MDISEIKTNPKLSPRQKKPLPESISEQQSFIYFYFLFQQKNFHCPFSKGSYAMGNRNTKHPAEVKALLAYLLSEECQSSSAFADKDMFPVRRGCLKKCMEAQYQFSVYDASHEKIGQEDIENRKEMYGDNLTDAQLDQLETICDKINAAQYHTIWYRALQLDQSEDGGNLLSETMVQYWNDEISLDELVDRLTPRLKLYLDE